MTPPIIIIVGGKAYYFQNAATAATFMQKVANGIDAASVYDEPAES